MVLVEIRANDVMLFSTHVEIFSLSFQDPGIDTLFAPSQRKKGDANYAIQPFARFLL